MRSITTIYIPGTSSIQWLWRYDYTYGLLWRPTQLYLRKEDVYILYHSLNYIPKANVGSRLNHVADPWKEGAIATMYYSAPMHILYPCIFCTHAYFVPMHILYPCIYIVPMHICEITTTNYFYYFIHNITCETPHSIKSWAAFKAASVGFVVMKVPMNEIPTDLLFQFFTWAPTRSHPLPSYILPFPPTRKLYPMSSQPTNISIQ